MTVAVAKKLPKPRKNLVQRFVDQILGVPLAEKIIGANAIIIVAGIGYEAFGSGPAQRAALVAMTVVMVIASVVNVSLVRLALKPVRDLVTLGHKVSGGDFNARSSPSPVADDELSRLGATVNELLDSLALERKRIRDLGAEVIFAQDAERARVSRELHDSIAQTIAAARFQIVAAGNGASDEVQTRLAAINDMLSSVTAEVRDVSNSLHPRVAEDLGLESALVTLASQIEKRSGVDVVVSVNVSGAPIPPNVAGTVYRVAEEALKNIEMHARAKSATVEVVSGKGSIRVEIADDGAGFDVGMMNRVERRTGLASVKDRVELAGGRLDIDSKANGGTRVVAEIRTSGDAQ